MTPEGKKTSQENPCTLDGTEEVRCVKSGGNARTTTGAIAALAGGVSAPPVNGKTVTAYTLTLADAPAASAYAGIVPMTNAAANAVTVPPHSAVAWQAGTTIQIPQLGAGQTSVVAGAGVTLHTPSTLLARVQFSALVLTYLGGDVWMVGGDMA